jgi:GT2 family glycosyltransferase
VPSIVSAVITTYNSASSIEACLNSLLRQRYQPLEIVVVDNASSDGTRDVLEKFRDRARIVLNQQNVGFAAAQNQGFSLATGDWLLSLNPDVILDPDFIVQLIAKADSDSQLGTLCGKLLRWQPGSAEERSRVIDSTGIYFTRNLRHFDRGAEELDHGQYDRNEYVFGATGAAALYRREMIRDVSVAGQFFDEDFFAYREDADVAWRARLMGWKCLYVPSAVGWHVRRVTPERFEQLPWVINWHSVKNRFLMRAKNISAPLYWRVFIPTTFRDLMIVGYCLLRDRRLLSALVVLWDKRKELASKRRWIQTHRRVPDRELFHWFTAAR